MGRKAVLEGGTRDEILKAALNLFFEKGFDGVTVRTIQREVGCEVGLFYYYFKSKDEVFDIVIKRFIEGYRSGFEEILDNDAQTPETLLDDIFGFIKEYATELNGKYGENLHWSVRGAVIDQFLELAKEYTEKALEIMIEQGMQRPETELDNLAGVLCFGIGRLIFDMDAGGYRKSREDIRTLAESLLGGAVDELFAKGREARRRRDISVELL